MNMECFFYRYLKNPKNPLVVQDGGSCSGYLYTPVFHSDPHVAYFPEAWWMMRFFRRRCLKRANENGIHLKYGGVSVKWFDKCLYRVSLKDVEDLLNGIKTLSYDKMNLWICYSGKSKIEFVAEAEKLIRIMKEEPDYDYYFIAWW